MLANAFDNYKKVGLVYLVSLALLLLLAFALFFLGDVGVVEQDLGSCKSIADKGDFVWLFYLYGGVSAAWILLGALRFLLAEKIDERRGFAGKRTALGSLSLITSFFLLPLAFLSFAALLQRDLFVFVILLVAPYLTIPLLVLPLVAVLLLSFARFYSRQETGFLPRIAPLYLLLELILIPGIPLFLVNSFQHYAISSC